MKRSSDGHMRAARAALDGTAMAFPGLKMGIMRIVKDKSLELRACPFCGKKAHLMAEDTVGGAMWTVRCGYCACQSPVRFRRQSAINRWQRRKA